jgi:Domain of unknown function (DUF5348)
MYKICYWTLEGRGAGNERYTWRNYRDQERIRRELEQSEGCAVSIAWISRDNPEQEKAMSNAGTLDYGSNHYKIVGGPDDGHYFRAGEGLEVHYCRQWVPAIIEGDANGCWYFLSPIDGPVLPTDICGLPVRLAHMGPLVSLKGVRDGAIE